MSSPTRLRLDDQIAYLQEMTAGLRVLQSMEHRASQLHMLDAILQSLLDHRRLLNLQNHRFPITVEKPDVLGE